MADDDVLTWVRGERPANCPAAGGTTSMSPSRADGSPNPPLEPSPRPEYAFDALPPGLCLARLRTLRKAGTDQDIMLNRPDSHAQRQHSPGSPARGVSIGTVIGKILRLRMPTRCGWLRVRLTLSSHDGTVWRRPGGYGNSIRASAWMGRTTLK
jgi:hypothetical protein